MRTVSKRTAKRPVTSLRKRRGTFLILIPTYRGERLSVLDGPEDVNLNVLFTGGGVLLELSVVHWQFSFVSGRESLLPRVSSPSVVSPNVSLLRPRNGGNSYKSTPHTCWVSTIFPTMYVETHEKFKKPTQTPRNIA